MRVGTTLISVLIKFSIVFSSILLGRELDYAVELLLRGELTLEEALEQVKKLIAMGEKPTDACKAVAKETGFKKGKLYSALQ